MENEHPYYGGNERYVEAFLRKTVDDLENSNLIDLQVDSESYGNNYSYWDVFCYKKKLTGSKTRFKYPRGAIPGIALYLCKLKPVAVMGILTDTKRKDDRVIGLHPEDINRFPVGDWTKVVDEIKSKLEKHGFVLLEPQFLKQTMPFEAKIQTIMTVPPYQIFDAFFHWED
jgi:hypothetical protein